MGNANANATETSGEAEMCTTRACVRAAARILARLDPTVDPCNDFYTFSCGSFLETSTVPDDANALSTLQEMQDEMLHTTRSESRNPSLFFIRYIFYISTCLSTSTDAT